jgi:hypothetical protein
MDTTSDKIVSSVIGVVAFLTTGVVTGILYIIVVGKILDRGGDGFGLVGAIVMFPLFITFAGLGWLVLWHLHTWKLGLMPTGRVIVGSVLFGLLISLVIAGPRGFTMHGGSTLINYFLIGGTLVGALGHLAIFRLLSRRRTTRASAAPESAS